MQRGAGVRTGLGRLGGETKRNYRICVGEEDWLSGPLEERMSKVKCSTLATKVRDCGMN